MINSSSDAALSSALHTVIRIGFDSVIVLETYRLVKHYSCSESMLIFLLKAQTLGLDAVTAAVGVSAA